MKKAVIFCMLLILASATACFHEKDSKIQSITYDEFFKKIWDAEKHPDSFVFEGNTAVIVDFYANWCGPCQQLFPILEKLANEYEGELIVYKVNKEVEENLASAFKVQGLPALLLIPKSGHPLKMYNGLPSEENLRTIIEEQLLDMPKQQ